MNFICLEQFLFNVSSKVSSYSVKLLRVMDWFSFFLTVFTFLTIKSVTEIDLNLIVLHEIFDFFLLIIISLLDVCRTNLSINVINQVHNQQLQLQSLSFFVIHFLIFLADDFGRYRV